MADFPHLKLPFKVEGRSKPLNPGRPNLAAKAITDFNKGNRIKHGEYLGESAASSVKKWKDIVESKKEEGIDFLNENEISVLLKLDTSAFNIDTLLNWGIEVISEEENGYIIGASVDGLDQFQENLNQFLKEEGRYKDKAAQIWEFVIDDSWRIKELLKGEIAENWGDIDDDVAYTLELGVSCYVHNKKNYPIKEEFDSEMKFQQKVNEFKQHQLDLSIERDALQMDREADIEKYLGFYGGELLAIWENSIDAICFKVLISGRGLKDLVQTYQYLYEVKLSSKFDLEHEPNNIEDNYELEVIPPNINSSKVCVIDSGIQENHRLIEPAIDKNNSRSYVDGDVTVADYVKNSGHGTKVCGAILYPVSVPKNGQYQLETYIQNARILDRQNNISDRKFAPALIEEIMRDYPETKIFNLSVSEKTAYIGTHMPSLAAALDKVIHENNVLFIVSAGNLKRSSAITTNLGISEYLQAGKNYPTYLNENETKIANPGVSYFAITVGSIAKEDFEDSDYIALAGKNYISPFSRTGLGMWGSIKPDVVEFGGDLIKNKLTNELITNESTAPELINSTLHGASAVGKDDCGTSFSTPKVSYIASKLQAEHPTESAQMYRALIIQSARLPDHCFNNPTLNDFRYYGYGIPDINRALSNSESRITFIQEGKVGPRKADIYQIKIPESLRGEGKEFRILVEVTLSFTAKTRLTRRGSHNYLSNWLEWKSSKYNEKFNSFRNRTIEYLEEDEAGGDEIQEANDTIKWIIRENPAWGKNGINRNNSTVQKSWVIIEPHQFAEEFSIAIIGHLGWEKDIENETKYAVCVSFEVLDVQMNIYDILSQAQVEIEPEQEIEI